MNDEPSRNTNPASEPTREDLLARMAELEAQHQQASLEREQLLALINSLPDDVFFVDASGNILFANDAVRHSLGVPDKGDVLGPLNAAQSKFQVLKADGTLRRPEENPFLPALRGEFVQGDEIVKNLETGEHRHRHYRITPVVLSGKVAGAVSLVCDDTVRRRAELELQQSERRYRSLFENMSEGFFLAEIICDAVGKPVDYRYLEVNAAFEILTGQQRGQVVGKTAQELLPGAEEHWLETYGRVAQTGKSERIEQFAAPFGRYYSTIAYSPKAGQFACLFEDVTERKHTERALQEIATRFQAVFENTKDSILLTDPATAAVVDANPAACQLFRYSREEFRGVLRGTILQPSADSLEALLEHRHATGSAGAILTFRRKDASRFRGELTSSLFLDELGRQQAVAVIRDVTDRERTADALRQSEQRYRMLHENLRDPFVQVSMDGRILDCNDLYCEMLGYTREELGTRSYQQLTPERWQTFEQQIFEEQIRQRGYSDIYEKEYQRKDGTLVHVELRTILSRNADGEPAAMWAIVRDVTERKRADEALAASERRVRRLLEASPIGAAIGEPSGRVIYANDTALRTVGISREQFDSGEARWDQVTAAEHGERDRKAIEQALANGTSDLYEKDYIRPDGTRVPVVLACASLGDGEIAAFSIDVTHLKCTERALRESEERFFKAFSSSPVPMTITTADEGRWVVVNDAYLRLVEFSREELLTRCSAELGIIQADEREKLARQLLESGCLHGVEAELQTKGGRRRTVLYFVENIVLDARTHAVTTLIDVTERRLAEDALKAANVRLEEADRRKDEFLAVLSHELRNPLAPITNCLYILDRVAAGSEQARRAKQTLDRQVAQLSIIVNDLLDVTRISRNKIELHKEQLELTEVIRQAVEDNRSFFERAGVHLELLPTTGVVPVIADRTRVMQAIGNVLQNSAKFTASGGHTQVSVALDGHEAFVRVSDDGVGLDGETRARLFQPFMQAEKTLARSQGGLGLGLALVKGLLELHGGSVTAASEGLGKGAEFVIRLPAVPEATPERQDPHLASQGTRRRILVIEDNVDAANSLCEALQLDGHVVEVAFNGHDGLTRARLFRPEVVLCDIGLPGMDGFDVARAIRADNDLKSTTLVALTGYARPEDLRRAAEAGFERHLAKPPCLEKLAEVLGRTAEFAQDRG
jgi:PAS domain S-box-containing protein